ncbi:MAG: PKD domain-containing protein [Desulfococcaceae bacterium]
MKKIFLAWIMICLLSGTNLRAADSEAESRTVPSLKSQESPDTKLFRQSDGNTAVSILSDEFPDIVLHVTVSDSSGNPVSGLTAADFAVSEQSETDTVSTSQILTCFEEGDEGTKISFSLVFDISGSMERENRLPDAKTAAVGFLNNAQPGDRASLVTFSGCDQGGIVIPVTEVAKDSNQNGVTDIAEAVQALTVIDRTAMYDGIANGLDSISQEPFPKGVIVFTDGDSNDDCHYSINTVIQKAKNLGIPVYTIGLQSIMGSQLRIIAESTGGYYREAPTFADMGEIYADIAQSLRGQYTLCYTTHNPSLDGTDRTVAVVAENSRGSGVYTVPGSPDVSPPAITHTPVAQWQENQTIPVTAQVSDPDDSITQVLLFFRIPGTDSSYTQSIMTNTGADAYAGEIPANQVTSAGVEYYITACNSRQICVSSASASAPHQITVFQNRPPVIMHTPVSECMANQPVSIYAQADDPDTGDNVDRVLLYCRIPGTDTYTSVPMTNAGANLYKAVIPAEQVTTAGIQYYISAWDTFGGYAESASAADPYLIDVTEVTTDIQPPVAEAGPDQSVNELDSVTLDGSGSAALTSDGKLDYSWRQISGSNVSLFNANTARPVFTAPAAGPEGAVLVFELTVTDSSEVSDSDTVNIAVNDSLAPEAAFILTPASPEAGDTIQFKDQSASKSGDIVSWVWDFGGEGNSSLQNPVFSFAESGTYSVRLTVRDGAGSSGTVIKNITVSEPPCAGGDCGGGSGGCFISSAGMADSSALTLIGEVKK